MAFPGNCSGRLIVVSGSKGCTMTRADIRGMTPQDFEDQGFREVGMDKIIAASKELRVAGYKERSLTTLLMSRAAPIKRDLNRVNIGMQGSVILPYIYRRQKRLFHSNYWKVTAGTPTPGAGSGGIHPGAFDLTVTNNPSTFGSTLPVASLYKYFLPGKVMFVEYSNASTNVAYSLQYKIVSAATDGSNVTKVTVQPNYTASGWSALSSGAKLPYQIGGAGGGSAVAGTIAFLGANSVSDYESWGHQPPAENPNSLLNFWTQTSRDMFEYNEEYLRALNAALTSGYFKTFANLPLAQQRLEQAAKNERDMLNSAFYGQRINENQTVEGYRNLEQVVDPANPSCVFEYKSNALGFFTQLGDCSRITDRQGNNLDIDSLAATGLQVLYSREADGSVNLDEEPVLDVMTDYTTAGQIQDIMLSFQKAKYGAVLTRNYAPEQELKFDNQVVMKFNTYQLPPEMGGFKLAVFPNRFFDHKLAAAEGANRQRELWMLDWSDVEFGIGATNSATRTTNEADELYRYVMKINKATVEMKSTMWCPILGDANRSAIIRNFNAECPSKTVTGCSVG